MANKPRGRSALSFHVSNLGFAPGETLPSGTVQPQPIYPPLSQRPTPLRATEVDEYLLALSQEFRGSIRDSPFFLKPKVVKRDIVRYTDRYKQTQKQDLNERWEPDWNYIPSELKPSVRKRMSKMKALSVKVPEKSEASVNNKDIAQTLDTLLQKEKQGGAGEVEEAGEEADDDEEVYYDEEELEDDNDYNFDHYDDGGDKYGDDDDGDDGPIY